MSSHPSPFLGGLSFRLPSLTFFCWMRFIFPSFHGQIIGAVVFDETKKLDVEGKGWKSLFDFFAGRRKRESSCSASRGKGEVMENAKRGFSRKLWIWGQRDAKIWRESRIGERDTMANLMVTVIAEEKLRSSLQMMRGKYVCANSGWWRRRIERVSERANVRIWVSACCEGKEEHYSLYSRIVSPFHSMSLIFLLIKSMYPWNSPSIRVWKITPIVCVRIN